MIWLGMTDEEIYRTYIKLRLATYNGRRRPGVKVLCYPDAFGNETNCLIRPLLTPETEDFIHEGLPHPSAWNGKRPYGLSPIQWKLRKEVFSLYRRGQRTEAIRRLELMWRIRLAGKWVTDTSTAYFCVEIGWMLGRVSHDEPLAQEIERMPKGGHIKHRDDWDGTVDDETRVAPYRLVSTVDRRVVEKPHLLLPDAIRNGLAHQRSTHNRDKYVPRRIEVWRGDELVYYWPAAEGYMRQQWRPDDTRAVELDIKLIPEMDGYARRHFRDLLNVVGGTYG